MGAQHTEHMSRERERPPIPRVAIVGPLGEFQTPRPLENSGGDGVIQYDAIEQEARIPKKYRELGWLLYSDLCAGNYKPINGGQPVEGMSHFRRWQKALAVTEAGQRLPPMPADFYHPEVYERRKRTRNRAVVADASVYADPGPEALPAADEEEAPKPKRRRRTPKSVIDDG